MDRSVSRPNILLIVTDQQRGDCLGLAGHPVLQTPNMDYIGGAGTNFRRGYSEVPSCIPARHVLMSGQAPDVSGMVGFYYRSEASPWRPAATLPGELRRAGYETRLIGKLHLQPQRRRWGFDAMELADGVGGQNNDYVDWLRERVPDDQLQAAHGTGANSWVGRPSHLPEHLSYSAWVVTRALEYLEKRDPSTPFFLNLSFFPPHPPLAPSRDFFERYAALDLPEPVIGDWVEPVPPGASRGLDPVGGQQRLNLDPLTMHYCRAAYYGLINEIDSQLGRLFNAMRGSLLANTYVIFVSDHGEMLGDHHRFAKTEPFEASARIPFMAMAPQPGRSRTNAEFPSGLSCDAPVGLQDVMPTLLDVAGVPIPPGVTGRSLVPFMRGEQPDWRDALHGEHCGYRSYDNGTHWLVSRTHKYIWYSQTGRELLFDLVDDPKELHDRSGEEDLEPWRRRMIEALADRPEGFTDGRRLIPGQPHRAFVPGKGPVVEWPDVGR